MVNTKFLCNVLLQKERNDRNMAIKRVNCIRSLSNWVCRTLALDFDPNVAEVVHRTLTLAHFNIFIKWMNEQMNE